ncbi:alcohol dehydrogenase catalytic domain-containing protein, partial [Planomonospora algeriensis]
MSVTRSGDVAGRVEAVGERVTRFRPGDEVFGTCAGALAEYACAPQGGFAPKPANVTFEQAAAPTSAFAALQGLRDAETAGPRHREVTWTTRPNPHPDPRAADRQEEADAAGVRPPGTAYGVPEGQDEWNASPDSSSAAAWPSPSPPPPRSRRPPPYPVAHRPPRGSPRTPPGS